MSGPATQVGISTTIPSRCLAIIPFNANNGMPGPHHYGALALTGQRVRSVIRRMIDDVAPTEIVLWPANASDSPFPAMRAQEMKSILLDNARVRTFLEFTKPSGSALPQTANQSFLGVKVQGGQRSFEAVSGSTTPPAKLAEGRTQSADIWWYHASAANSAAYAHRIQQAVSDILILILKND